ncbi:MAG: T9SS type A sorting domain-containing protein [Bacteroidota bacterium]
MKKFTLLFSLLLSGILGQLNAQTCALCTPAFTTCPPTGGLCNRLDTAYANQPYDKVINFYMPKTLTDPSVLAQCQCNSVILREIRITGVSGLPAGITYTLHNNGQYNVQNGDSIGCVRFCGTPLVPGLYSVAVYLLADVTALGTLIGDVVQNNNPQQYYDTLLVLPDTAGGVSSFTFGTNGSSACNSISVDLNALYSAPTPNMTRYFWNLGNGQTSQLKNPGIINYTNASITKPDTFPVTLTTVFYNYTVKKIQIAQITGGFSDIEEPGGACTAGIGADPYAKFNLLGFNNIANQGSNTCSNINFDNLNVSIPLGTQNIDLELWDADSGPPFGTADDLLGTYNLTIHLGQENYSNNNAYGYVQFDTVAGTTITETLNVIVNPYPVIPTVIASSDTFCASDSVRISLNNDYSGHTYEWYRDTVFLTAATDSFFTTNQVGNYKVKVTNQSTGCQSESGWKEIVKVQSPAPSISILFNGTSAFVTPFPSSGFAVDWYFNGNLVTGQNGKFLTFLGNGDYRAEVYNTNFPTCRSSSSVETIISGINELADNSVYGLNVFPNPNQGKFTLKYTVEETQNVVLHIQNIMGQTIAIENLVNFPGEFVQEIDARDWSKGVYFIAIETAKGNLNRKIIVQ